MSNYTQEEYSWMAKAMRTYGGGFIMALESALGAADQINFQKLINAFPEYIEEYIKMGTIMRRKQEGHE